MACRRIAEIARDRKARRDCWEGGCGVKGGATDVHVTGEDRRVEEEIVEEKIC